MHINRWTLLFVLGLVLLFFATYIFDNVAAPQSIFSMFVSLFGIVFMLTGAMKRIIELDEE